MAAFMRPNPFDGAGYNPESLLELPRHLQPSFHELIYIYSPPPKVVNAHNVGTSSVCLGGLKKMDAHPPFGVYHQTDSFPSEGINPYERWIPSKTYKVIIRLHTLLGRKKMSLKERIMALSVPRMWATSHSLTSLGFKSH